MKILGLTSGIGSMMFEEKDHHEIIGNIEWRPYYHSGTFEKNFKGSWMEKSWDKLDPIKRSQTMNVDLVIGHTECGSYSNLNTTGVKRDAGDIPIFMNTLQRITPKFFVMDNLPKSFLEVPLENWIRSFPDYNIEAVWISNYNYGNTQKNRNRLFIIGSKKELEFKFVPSEFYHDMRFIDIVRDLPEYEDIPEINHIHLKPDDKIMDLRAHYFELETPDGSMTFQQFKDNVDNYRIKRQICYVNKNKEFHKKPGYNFMDLNNYSPTINGRENAYRFDTYQPLTIRERARIQGFTDDFIFYPLLPKTQAEKLSLIKQTGKCMPVQFCGYVTRLIADHLGEGPEVFPTGNAFLQIHPLIEEEIEYCKLIFK